MENANKDEYEQRHEVQANRKATQCEHIHSHDIYVRKILYEYGHLHK